MAALSCCQLRYPQTNRCTFNRETPAVLEAPAMMRGEAADSQGPFPVLSTQETVTLAGAVFGPR